MGRHDWYRNTDWDAAIASAFFAKLSRARDKAQYLRIQACTLTKGHPTVALSLLEQYFALGDHFDHAQAYVDRATAFLTLGQVDAAIHSYEAALEREAVRPNLTTQAYLDLPFLVATQGLTARYDQARMLLEKHRLRLSFPVDHFRWHAALALIALDAGPPEAAVRHARLALDAAAREHSGLRYHADLGLVGAQYEDIRMRLAAAVA
jgi:tetratricopeptide (TPR) repeat protein